MEWSRRNLMVATSVATAAEMIANPAPADAAAAAQRPLDPGELRNLVSEVRYLRDRSDIIDCINSYIRGIDRLDAALLSGAFHVDAVDNHGDFVGYVPEFVKWAIAGEGQFRVTHHNITTHTCQVEGDTAHAESYCVWFVLGNDDVMHAGGGRYVDRLERRGGVWKVELRRLLLDWRFRAPVDQGFGTNYSGGSRDRNDPSYQRPLMLPPEIQTALRVKEQHK